MAIVFQVPNWGCQLLPKRVGREMRGFLVTTNLGRSFLEGNFGGWINVHLCTNGVILCLPRKRLKFFSSSLWELGGCCTIGLKSSSSVRLWYVYDTSGDVSWGRGLSAETVGLFVFSSSPSSSLLKILQQLPTLAAGENNNFVLFFFSFSLLVPLHRSPGHKAAQPKEAGGVVQTWV